MTILELIFLCVIIYLFLGMSSLFLPLVKTMLSNENNNASLLCIVSILIWPIFVISTIVQWVGEKLWFD